MSKETEHLLSSQTNTNRLEQSIKQLDMQNEPLKITLEFCNKKISTEIDHSDLELEGYCLSFYAYKDIEKLENFMSRYTSIKDKNNN